MKKISLLLSLALSLGFAACDDYDMPNPPAQYNPQEPVMDAATLQMTAKPDPTQTIDLSSISEAGEAVELARIDNIENLPAGYALEFVAEVAKDDTFTEPFECSTTVTDNVVYANPDVLTDAFRSVLGTIDPAAQTVNIRFKAYAVNGTSNARLGGADVYYCPLTASIKPFDPDFTVEEAYYIIGTCTDGKIDPSTAILMTNSGKSPYDDPEFSAPVSVTADQAANGYQWAIVPQSTMTAGSGVVLAISDENLSEESKGYLKNYQSTENYPFGMIYQDQTFLITFNAKADNDGLYSYSVELATPVFYTPGPSNGWSFDNSQKLYPDARYKNYQGYVHISGEFKFTTAPDWSHINYGFAENGKLTTDGSAGNIKVNQNGEELTDGLYWCSANIADLSYTATRVNTIGIIGSATPGGWDTETQMIPSEDFMTWTLTTKLVEGELKFRSNNEWDFNNLGGSLDALVPFGPNITISGPQTGENVTITLHLNTITEGVSWYTATIE